jgi:hypothetical protein
LRKTTVINTHNTDPFFGGIPLNNFFTVDIPNIDRNEALRYLAYGGKVPDENLTAYMDKCEEELLKCTKGKFTFRVFDIKINDGEKVTLDGCTLVMAGKDICSHLEGCSKAVLMCATVGGDTDKLIRTMEVTDMASAVITDAMAGCAVEYVCNKAEEKIREEYPNMYMTWRFSPGYGDMPITLQNRFLDVTNASRTIGLFASENHILTPRKSVTAVIGLSDEKIEKKRQGCIVCRVKDKCELRKVGRRCTDE